ncbi:MAG TPA: cupin domain-containing protein [Polyangiaceae bacterium]|jgi:predicted cupin superfamily sugar epimerase|nr:cupin domain-containing protein [Polyangiaceae bacterium]
MAVTQRLPPKARALIRRLGLLPHPEGGYYREVYRSTDTVQTHRAKRCAVTTIYFLLVKGQRSVLHRVTSDEIWHFYQGDPLELIDVSPDMRRVQNHRLGPTIESEKRGAKPVAVIEAHHWQAAATKGLYSLVGCSVAPGFEFSDFTLLRNDPKTRRRFERLQPKLLRWI